MSSFRFKQFEVQDSASAMKVGTDAVLLGAWMTLSPSDIKLLDIGAGTGIISLMAAQRNAQYKGLRAADYAGYPDLSDFSAWPQITSVEIDRLSCEEAAGNFAASPWGSQLHCVNSSIQDYVASHPEYCASFDIVFTNPPYFIDSLKAPEGRRSNARHTDTLSHDDILTATAHLLKPTGRLALILPAEEAEEFIRTAALFHIGRDIQCEFHLTRLCKVHTTPRKPPKRYLMEFSTSSTSTPDIENHLYIQDGPSFTEDYKSITKDFYLKF